MSTSEDCESRLRTMLGNVFRLRTLWDLCNGGSVPMRWASFDQKPSWFNNAGLKSLYAKRGSRIVGAREDHHGTRQRYTIMTSVLSWSQQDDADPPPCAILVKGESDRALGTCTFAARVLARSDARVRYMMSYNNTYVLYISLCVYCCMNSQVLPLACPLHCGASCNTRSAVATAPKTASTSWIGRSPPRVARLKAWL